MANSHPSSSHLDLTEAAWVLAFTTGLVEPIRSVGPYQTLDGRGSRGSLLINWPDGTETPQMGKNNDPWCEKADRVSQPWKFSQCNCIQTARLNQLGLHTYTTASMIYLSGCWSVWLHWFPGQGDQCSLSIPVFKHNTVRYKRVIAVREDFMFCQVTLFLQVIRNLLKVIVQPNGWHFTVSLYYW